MTVPFLVVDRPASLEIIRNIKIPFNKQLGLMSHANTTNLFKELFRDFPCTQKDYCEVIRKRCPYKKNYLKCKESFYLQKKCIKIADSGVFTKEGCIFSYNDLFKEYEKMNVNFGVMIDYLKDHTKTIESARKAMDVYDSKKWNFKLIGVIQGNKLDEYIECYKLLKKIGFQYIAVGGLLKKRVNTARYVQVKDENLLWSVLSKIRRIDQNGSIYALGCYAPSRHNKFLNLGIWGSDYKGWIFQYKKRYLNAKRGDVKARKSRFFQIRNFIYNNILNKEQIKLIDTIY